MTSPTSAQIRERLVHTLRRDLIGPGPEDEDLQRERLNDKPSGWYVTGFLAPVPPTGEATDEELEEEGNPIFGDDDSGDAETGPARAADDQPDDEPPAVRVRAPSSLGLTVLLDASVNEVEVKLSWGDYVTIPPVSEEALLDDKASAPDVEWKRVPSEALFRVPVPRNGRGPRITVPGSGGAHRPSGALQIEAHARPYTVRDADGSPRELRVLTLMIVNRRSSVRRRRYQDVTYAFQVRLCVMCESGLYPRSNMRGLARKIWMKPTLTCTIATSVNMQWV